MVFAIVGLQVVELLRVIKAECGHCGGRLTPGKQGATSNKHHTKIQTAIHRRLFRRHNITYTVILRQLAEGRHGK